jgi:hypothetical protein
MKFLLILTLLMGCGKKTIYTNPPMPENQASTAVQSEIDEELVRLEEDFKALDLSLNLQQMPVIVSPLPFGVVGRCQYGKDNKGIFIILSPALFPADGFRPMDSFLFEKEFVKVLIHEIGHCYFRRMHEEPQYLAIPGSSFELKHEDGNVIFDKIPTSVMPAESTYRLPKTLRNYYLSELAGKARLENPTVLGEFTDFQIVSNEKSDTVDPTDKEGSHIP